MTRSDLRRAAVRALTLAVALGAAAAPARAQNLTLHGCGDGGIVYEISNIVIIYWTHASGKGNDPAAYDDVGHEAEFTQNFMHGLLGSTFTDTLTQYYQDLDSRCALTASGSTNSDPSHLLWYHYNQGNPQVTTMVVDTLPANNTPSMDDERRLVDSIVGAGNWYTMPIVLYAPGGVPPGLGGACAYHDRSNNAHEYMSIPYQRWTTCAGGTGEYDHLARLLEHEYAEAVTAPHNTPAGWYITGVSESEVADHCGRDTRPVQLIPRGVGPASVAQITQLWSNAANRGAGGCVWSRARGYDNFYVGADGAVWDERGTNNYALTWGTANYGGASYKFASALSATSWGPLHTSIVGFDSNRHLVELRSLDLGVSVATIDWGAVPGFMSVWVGKPEVTSWGAARLDLFATSFSLFTHRYTLWHRAIDNGADSGWQYFSAPGNGASMSAPAAVASTVNAIDAFVTAGGHLWRLAMTDGATFGPWQDLGAFNAASEPDAASWAPGRLDVFARDPWGNLAHWFDDGGYMGQDTWTPPAGATGAIFVGTPTATGMGDDRLQVTAMTSSGAFAHYLWDFGGSSWVVVPANWGALNSTGAVVAF